MSEDLTTLEKRVAKLEKQMSKLLNFMKAVSHVHGASETADFFEYLKKWRRSKHV